MSQTTPTQKYPYLLNDLPITFPNQVWGTDITYIRLTKGFCYLVAIIDWFSRYVVAWQLSDTLHMDFCLENLNRALTVATPDIHNSDQGSHFTSPSYTSILARDNIQISMDGRGRCMDNIFTERLWRTVKYEDVYIKSYATIGEAREGLNLYFPFYNKNDLTSRSITRRRKRCTTVVHQGKPTTRSPSNTLLKTVLTTQTTLTFGTNLRQIESS